MISTFEECGIEARILDAVDWVNEKQKHTIQQKIETHFGDVRGKTIAIWGLAFKPKTDDIREAPALVLIERLLELGANIRVHDPEAMANVREIYQDKIEYFDMPMDVLDNADALAIMTEWSDFRTPDFDEMKKRLRGHVIFDGRNLYGIETMEEAQFTYYSIGRPPVRVGQG